jgi:hypothetical protein
MFLVVLLATIAAGDETKFTNKVIEIHHRDPRLIADVVRLLGSGFGNAGINVNEEMHTLTVRDFPENVAQIEAAIQRLDVAPAAEPEIEFHIFVLVGNVPAAGEVPEELAPVMKQLQTTLRFRSYSLVATNIVRTRAGDGVEVNGMIADRTFGMDDPGSAAYTIRLNRVVISSGEKRKIDIANFKFGMHSPFIAGFDTPVTLHEGEKVVVGTSAIRDKPVIVVVTAKSVGS